MRLLYTILQRALLAVLLVTPMIQPTVAQTLKATEATSSLTFDHLSFINDLIDDLVDNAPYTIFLPSEAAFHNLPAEQKEALFTHPYLDLIDLIKGHMVSGVLSSEDLVDGQILTALNGNKLFVKQEGDSWYVNNVMISYTDINLHRSLVHRIEGVLFRPETVFDIIAGSDDHTTLEAAIVAAELKETLMGEGPFTVFAPTDEAFDALPEGTVAALLEDPTGDLAQILLYHVVAGKAMSGDLHDGQMIVTVNGKEVKVTIDGSTVMINDAMVTVADLEADNGVVHVIDAVLLPPTITVFDIIAGSDDHTTLEAAIVAAELKETLMGEGPFTVFAPTDEAFDALPEGTVAALLEDPTGDLAQILLYHVVAGKAMSGDLHDGQMIVTVNGKEVKVTIDGSTVMINDAMVTVADIEADNGVVHVIDAVLIPPTITVFDIIAGSDDHTTLEAAIVAAELKETLMGEGPFTVFAPTDEAFDALPEGTVAALLEDPTGDLAQILLYHVVAGKAMSGDLHDGQMIVAVNGKEVKVTIDGSTVMINDAMVTVADLEADNGVVHVIDAVLLPPTITVFDIIAGSDDHTTLEAAIVAAELKETLIGEGPFTVFAPTDEAFDALPEGTVAALLEDPTGDLAQILLYHVVAGKAMSGDLHDGQMIVTVNGKEVKVTIDGSTVMINDAMVTLADLEADNGVVHVIDAVLLPPTTVTDFLEFHPSLTTLVSLLKQAGLWETLMGLDNYTLFAPTNEAFDAIQAGRAQLKSVDDELVNTLLYHLADTRALSGDLFDDQTLTTLQGGVLTVDIQGDQVFINDALVIGADNAFDEGVVHLIDKVLVPEATNVNALDAKGFSIYPNPAFDDINIQLGIDPGEVATVNIYDVSGQLVRKQDLNATSTALNISDLPNGIYLFKVSIGDDYKIEKVVIK
ncbi:MULTISPECIES: fasciclin domain-containing protein [unclassified Carboxylicivirga]|uniref:fasciclin domain-containing protein n=1 Tax=Carboxylicivirga TaxID=1628153 RepID=UPI003D341AB1